jgi:DNA-binding GntR family transcriptional regulator
MLTAGESSDVSSRNKKNSAGQRTLDSIYLDVRQRILTKTLYPGQRLSENLLARKYGISRTPIREILKRLEHDGLVRIVPQSGTYVQHRSTRKIVELYQVRTYLECLAFRLAIERVSQADVKQLSTLASGFDRQLGVRPFNARNVASAHFRFHLKIVKTAGNETLLGFYERLHLSEAHVFDETLDNEGQRKTCAEHHKLVQLLELRSPEGEKLMMKHLWETAEYLIAAENSGGAVARSGRSRAGPLSPACGAAGRTPRQKGTRK